MYCILKIISYDKEMINIWKFYLNLSLFSYCSYHLITLDVIDTYYVTNVAQSSGMSATPKMHSLTAMSHIHIDIGKTQLNLYLVITYLVVHRDVRFVTVVPFSMLLLFRSTYIETIDFRATGHIPSGYFRPFMILLKRSKNLNVYL